MTATPDHDAFLRDTLPRQTVSMAPHVLEGRRVWLKKAGPRNPRWRYAVLSAIARSLRLEVLSPVPNLGGEAAIEQEARRLRALDALGLRVPQVLAQQPAGLLISDLGDGVHPVDNLLVTIAAAARVGPHELLHEWQRGLAAIADVHARGGYLSQAFARNLVDCPDGTVGFIDFEDDPGLTLPLATCQARDWLSYVQSTALYLLDTAAMDPARVRWSATVIDPASAEVRALLARTARRIGWLARLPAGRRWGTDTARLRAAALFLRGA